MPPLRQGRPGRRPRPGEGRLRRRPRPAAGPPTRTTTARPAAGPAGTTTRPTTPRGGRRAAGRAFGPRHRRRRVAARLPDVRRGSGITSSRRPRPSRPGSTRLVAAAEEHNDRANLANADALREGDDPVQNRRPPRPRAWQLDRSAAFARMTTDTGDATVRFINDEHRQYWSPWVARARLPLAGRPVVHPGRVQRPAGAGRQAEGAVVLDAEHVPRRDVPTPRTSSIKLPRNPEGDADAVRLGIAKRDGPARWPRKARATRPGPAPDRRPPRASVTRRKWRSACRPSTSRPARTSTCPSGPWRIRHRHRGPDTTPTPRPAAGRTSWPAPPRTSGSDASSSRTPSGPALTAAPGDVYTVTGMVSLVLGDAVPAPGLLRRHGSGNHPADHDRPARRRAMPAGRPTATGSTRAKSSS